jgi:hypothetical protein
MKTTRLCCCCYCRCCSCIAEARAVEAICPHPDRLAAEYNHRPSWTRILALYLGTVLGYNILHGKKRKTDKAQGGRCHLPCASRSRPTACIAGCLSFFRSFELDSSKEPPFALAMLPGARPVSSRRLAAPLAVCLVPFRRAVSVHSLRPRRPQTARGRGTAIVLRCARCASCCQPRAVHSCPIPLTTRRVPAAP